MSQLRFASVILSLLLLSAASLPCAPALSLNKPPAPQEERGQRIRPPDSLSCSRNDLTSFTGRVLSYSRTNNRLYLRMRTDEETLERFTLRYGSRENPTKWFLLRAEPFKDEDWKLIESRRGRLLKGMRATVWVCTGSAKPVIDWQPPQQ
jgi:hypothetical protein